MFIYIMPQKSLGCCEGFERGQKIFLYNFVMEGNKSRVAQDHIARTQFTFFFIFFCNNV